MRSIPGREGRRAVRGRELNGRHRKPFGTRWEPARRKRSNGRPGVASPPRRGRARRPRLPNPILRPMRAIATPSKRSWWRSSSRWSCAASRPRRFVIPTGSMAPTLMGRHKELACPECGFVYAVNASEEVDPRAVNADRPLGIVRQLPVPGPARRRAEFQRRPDPGHDVSVRPSVAAGQRPASAVGRGCVSLPRRARGELHQAPGRVCPARRSKSFTATST